MLAKLKEQWLAVTLLVSIATGVSGWFTLGSDYFEAPFKEFVKINTYSEVTTPTLKGGDTLMVKWAWSNMPNTPYCYEYHIFGASVSYDRPIPGACIRDATPFSNKPDGYSFLSSTGVLIPTDIPPGKYFLVYLHFPQDEWHEFSGTSYKFKPLEFEVVS